MDGGWIRRTGTASGFFPILAFVFSFGIVYHADHVDVFSGDGDKDLVKVLSLDGGRGQFF